MGYRGQATGMGDGFEPEKPIFADNWDEAKDQLVKLTNSYVDVKVIGNEEGIEFTAKFKPKMADELVDRANEWHDEYGGCGQDALMVVMLASLLASIQEKHNRGELHE